jgi:ribosomal protein L37E
MYCHCGNISENKDTGECASCGADRRKAERMTVKEKKPINKVSDKRKPQLKEYAALREKFLLNKWCAYHGRPCLPTQIHHQMGRVGFADEKEIPLLLDVRYWIPVCQDAHQWITEHSKEAIEQGYSFNRI